MKLFEKCEILRSNLFIKNPLPKNLKSEDSVFFKPLESQELPKVFIYELKNCNILPDGIIYKWLIPFKESFILTAEGPKKTHNWKGLLKIELTWQKEVLPEKNLYLLAFNNYKGYFHWLAETLPRLFLIGGDLSEYTLILPESYQEPFYLDSLKLMGVSNIVRIKENITYKVSRLFFPAVTAPLGNYDPEILQKMRQYFFSKIESGNANNFPSLIYISRGKATKRKIINENKMLPLLENYGFSILYFEDFSFTEQIQICRNAKCVISLHGAGLTNIMFMPEHASVLELRKFDAGENYFFYTLAAAVNAQYYYQFCVSDKPNLSVQEADIMVNLEELEININTMLGNKREYA